MLTFYSILLLTTDADGDPVEEKHFATFMEDVETLLRLRMNEGDTALVYQVDAQPPATAEEAVAWLTGAEQVCLQILVAEATRESAWKDPVITATEMTALSGFMYSPQPEAQA